MVWDIQEKNDTDVDKEWGIPKKIMKGKNNFPVLVVIYRSLSLHQ
jgi:hypothetical protein